METGTSAKAKPVAWPTARRGDRRGLHSAARSAALASRLPLHVWKPSFRYPEVESKGETKLRRGGRGGGRLGTPPLLTAARSPLCTPKATHCTTRGSPNPYKSWNFPFPRRARSEGSERTRVGAGGEFRGAAHEFAPGLEEVGDPEGVGAVAEGDVDDAEAGLGLGRAGRGRPSQPCHQSDRSASANRTHRGILEVKLEEQLQQCSEEVHPAGLVFVERCTIVYLACEHSPRAAPSFAELRPGHCRLCMCCVSRAWGFVLGGS